MWLDCRALNLIQEDLVNLFVKKAHLALNDGEIFGKEGIGYMRLNVAVPRPILVRALSQLNNAIRAV